MKNNLPDIEIEAVKFTKEGKRFPVGEGRLTKHGTGYALEIFPGQTVRGKIYIFPKEAKAEPKSAPKALLAPAPSARAAWQT